MDLILYIIILLYSIILHEIAHGYAAFRNGDDLAYREGRLTLNPMSHIDPIGSIIVPLIGYATFGIPFGWAKPVPYRPEIVRQNKYGILEVSAAGVITNFFLSFLAILIFYIFSHFGLINQAISQGFYLMAVINIMLATFNLLPFPPADGWHIFSELYKHIKSFLNKIKSKITGKHYHEAYYRENNFTKKINFFFSNPIMMIVIIFLAVQVFGLFSEYILGFINYFFLI